MVAMLVLVNIPFSSFLHGLYILFLLDLIALQIYLYMNMVMLDLESSQLFVYRLLSVGINDLRTM